MDDIIPGVLFHAYATSLKKRAIAFLQDITLVLQVAGQFTLETADEKALIERGMILLIGRNQLGQIVKTPIGEEGFQTIIICLEERLLRQIAIEEQVETAQKYSGPKNIIIAENDFLTAYFQSVMPYARHAGETVTNSIGLLKVKELITLLLHTFPDLKSYLFDFSQPYKIDLEKFMLCNFQYNLPVEKFAQLTGRSLAAFKRDFQKTFGMAPRQWLRQKRLHEARHLIEKKKRSASSVYLELGFESLAHFSRSFKRQFGKPPTKISSSYENEVTIH
jgi:AraC-like DNA-binding protein